MTMIKTIALKNFMAFKSISVECSNLNILTGYNGAGKSSLWKALCLLRQSFLKGYILEIDDVVSKGKPKDLKDIYALYLKGPLVIDTPNGVYHRYGHGDITIAIDWDSGLQFSGNFEHPYNTHPYLIYAVAPITLKNHDTKLSTEFFKEIELFNKHEFKFFDAQREFISFPFVAEYRPPLPMAKFNKRLDIHIQSMFPNIHDSYWFDTEACLGLGLKHALPIVKALLSAYEGELIIIENPETYLHPHAQAELGRLMACVAAQGVQLFVETQSEYLLNAIRVEIKKENIHHQQVNTLFFNENKEIKAIPIDKDGKIVEWPEGFFGEMDTLLFELFGI